MSTEEYKNKTLSDVFKELLKTLCLDEYPCQNVKQNNKLVKFSNGKTFKIKDDDEYIYRKEDLLDLIRDKNSPWYINYEWSSEANTIRELYISQVKAINLQNTEQYFKTLRLVDKNIKHVDIGLLKFKNLTELLLNVNWIENCDYDHLPASLKVLDLGGNQMKDLDRLVKNKFENLEHLGLSYNHLYNLNDYFNPFYWPSLVSLDLSANHLDDLKDLVANKLKKLEKLKNLVLYGNPLCLIPSYRGFVVDSLIQLNYFDDQSISRDERFRFFNMKLYGESIKNEAFICITVTNLKNIYMPFELKYPENQPEYPVVVFKYLVSFNFVHDTEFEGQNNNDDSHSLPESRIQSAVTIKTKSNKTEVNLDEKIQSKYMELLKDRFTENKTYKNKTLQTQPCDYNENIQFNEKGVLKIRHKALKSLRDFMVHGLEIQVIEQKLTYDQPSEDNENESASPSLSKKGGDKKKDEKKASAKKDKAPIQKNAKTPAGDKKKKDPNAFLSDLELKKTEDSVLANFNLSLDSILDCSRYNVEKSFKKELLIPEYVSNEFENNLDASVGGKSNKDKKDKKANKPQQLKPEPVKGGNDKGKKKAEQVKGSTPAVDENTILTPNVMELNLKLDITQFKTFEEFRTHLNTTQNISAISKYTKDQE